MADNQPEQDAASDAGQDDQSGSSPPAAAAAVSSTVWARQRSSAIIAIRKIVKTTGSVDSTTTEIDVAEMADRLDYHFHRFCAAHEGILQVTGPADLCFQQIEKDTIVPVYEHGRNQLQRIRDEIRARRSTNPPVEARVAAARRSRDLAMSRMAKVREWVTTDSREQHASIDELQDRMQHLQEMWKAFYAAHDSILLNPEGDLGEEQHEMEDAEEVFFATKSAIRRRMAAVRSADEAQNPRQFVPRDNLYQPHGRASRTADSFYRSHPADDDASHQIHAAVHPSPVAASAPVAAAACPPAPYVPAVPAATFRLPRIELPRFAGSYAEWTSFRDQFMCLIGSVAAISNVNKLHYLKSCVEGEAATLIRAYPVTDHNFAHAWAALADRYDNTRLVVNTHLQALHDAQPSQADSAISLRKLSDVFAENVAMLAGLHEPVDHWDAVLVYWAAGKLDVESARQWETSLAADARPTFWQFQRFVEVRCRALEAVERNRQSRSSVGSADPKDVRRNPFGGAPRAMTVATEDNCALCLTPHRLYVCQRFNSMSVGDRRAFVTDQRLCFNCLSAGHLVASCPRSSCRTCQQRHHTLLHADRTSADTTEAPIAHTCTTEPRDETLLATANVLVRAANGERHVVRALIDPASTDSFVTEDCVQRLRLAKQAGAVAVSGIGRTSAGRATGIADVHVGSAFDAQFALQIRAFVMRTISAPLPARKLPDSVLHRFADVQLADSNFHIPHGVDLLLGAKVFEAIWRDGTISSDSTGPCGKLTVFGWVAIGAWTSGEVAVSRPQAMLSVDVCSQLNEQVEELPSIAPKAAAEMECERHYDLNTVRAEDGCRVPFTSDIAKMSRPIALADGDRVFQRILWGEKERDDMQEYRLTTETYGTTSAQFLAVRTLLKLAEEEGAHFPRAAKVLSSDCYVDHLMTSGYDVKEAVELRIELEALLAAGGFALMKWAANQSDDMTGAASIAALHRRWWCAEMHRDCGTNFEGADAEVRESKIELAQQIAAADSTRVQSEMETEWRFIPPGSPTFGGLWESAEKSTKHHLRLVLSDAPLTCEGMSTMLAQVEASSHSRPLCAMSDSPDGISALTPCDFFIPHPNVSSVPSNRLSRWQYVQQLVQQFWGRWQHECMVNLQTRGKWRRANLAVDLVLWVGEQRSPIHWSLERIEQLFPRADGHVRVASVRTTNSSACVRRTAWKLCRLPDPNNED